MECKKMRLAGFLDNSLVNGDGIRSVVFVSGCTHNCPGCHNKCMQDKNYGDMIEVNQVYERIMDNYPLINGVTFSGGEPFENSLYLKGLAEKLKKSSDMDIWCYTGYNFEQIVKSSNNEWKELLNNIDVLVDGKFNINLKDDNLKYRGSKNQRIIDVKQSLKSSEVVCIA